ncbi:BatA domain-containing protein [candidate division KSB1 bacterium]
MSFINPIFLYALGAAALPVIYHLIRKMRTKTIPFSSLLFLKATPKELIKRRRLRDMLLLLIRTMMLLLLALVFARPFITEEKLPFASGERDKSVVILIDNSFSMQFTDYADRAREQAEDILNDAGTEDEFSIVVFNDEARQVTELSKDLTIHRTYISNSFDVSNRPTDFYKPVKLAEEILKDAQNPEKQIILISDFQETGWSSQFENWKIERNITFIPTKIESENTANNFIEAFNLKVNRNRDQVSSEIAMRIGNYEGDPREEEVSLILNGTEVDKKPARETQGKQVFFQRPALRTGKYQGEIRIGEDDLGVDNVHYFNFVVDDRFSVASINGEPNADFFISNAFNLGEYSQFVYNAQDRFQYSTRSFAENKLVFLNNFQALSAQQTGFIEEYVNNGGTLLVSFGDRVNTERFSANLQSLGAGRIEEKVVVRRLQRSDAIIGEVDLKHPVFSLFAEYGASDLFKPRFREYFKIEPDTGAVVLARYDTGDPFLIERKIGKGRILVYTSTLNTEWCDFPVNEIFLPFLYQIAEYAVTSERRRDEYFVGEYIMITGDADEDWDIYGPGNTNYKVRLDGSGTGYFRDTEMPGNYSVSNGTTGFNFSINIDNTESVLGSKGSEEVYSMVVMPITESPDEVEVRLAGELEAEEKKQKFWKYILIVILMLFLTETFLANRKLSINT